LSLSTNEVRARAADFAREWKDDHYERGEAQSFYNDFFQVFGVKRRQVATFEEPVKRLGDKRGFIDLFWKSVLLVEHKSAGKNLAHAKEQALEYFPNLKPEELPRYLLICDFQNFELYDLDERTEVRFPLADLPKHVEAFNFIRGLQKSEFKDQDPVNIKASLLVGALHDALEKSGYTGHDLERLLVRIVFCLFADDTGIFEPRGIMEDYFKSRTNEDGSDTGSKLIELFHVLNTPEEKRQTNLDEDLTWFPYINGDLFSERLNPPAFDSKMRNLLLEACAFNWSPISPAIFGALFQSVMEPAERRRKGAHYTTELNILKLIRPLFLDRLRADLDDIKTRKGADRQNKLKAFHDRLADMTFFDPACGCGNFLVITYRELRRLEIEVLKELHPKGAMGFRQGELDVEKLSKLDVDRFYGIELEEFPARIAETALWMMDHIMNVALSEAFGQYHKRIPLKKAPSIHCADALETDWTTVLPPDKCSYIIGNPPFSGAKYQDARQRVQVRSVANLGGSGGTLDYVSAWFLKAAAYVQPKECTTEIAFVATNSITQGEQVAQLWPVLFSRYGLEINFAHRTFAWGSDARGKAHVHVVIIGLSKRSFEWVEKRLFSYEGANSDPHESRHEALSPYLFDASNLRDRHLVVEERNTPISDVPKMIIGSKPIDGGYLIFSNEEKSELISEAPSTEKYLRPFVGSVDYIQGGGRWILTLQNASPAELRIAQIAAILKKVKEYRLGKLPPKRKAEGEPKPPGISSRALADTPTQFHVTVIPERPFLVIPEVSSERREYVPIGWLEPPTVPSNLVRIVPDADLWNFGIITSRMHMAWLRYIGGRLESRYRYSVSIVYNDFPWPEPTETSKENIRKLARGVLDTRAKFPGATLADLYDANTMKPELRKAHRDLDNAVDKLYKQGGFQSDRERVEHLFTLYEKLADPLLARSGKVHNSVRARRTRGA
jgi:hypothetical protein